MSRALPLLWVATCVAAAAAPQERTAEIHGRTLDAVTLQPVRGAVARIGDSVDRLFTDVPFSAAELVARASAPRSARGFLTSTDGRFIMRGVTPGSVTITATKHGYFAGASGRRRPNGTAVPIVVAAGDRITGVDVLLWPMASIAGTVTDERGAPMAGVAVVVSRKLEDTVPRQTGPVAGTGLTDDNGRYTVGGLGTGDHIAGVIVSHRAAVESLRYQPGFTPADRYSLAGIQGSPTSVQLFTSSPPHVVVSGRRLAYAGVFYGGVSDPSLATSISLRDGEERAGVDLRMEPQPVVRIAGTVTGSNGPLPLVSLQLSSGSVTASGVSSADGSFVFENVPAGVYDLAAYPPIGSRPSMLAAGAPPVISGMAANRDLSNVIVALGVGPTVSGMVIAPADVDVDRVRIRLGIGESTFTVATPSNQRGFAIPAVAPGRYLIRIESTVPDVVLESVELRGRNVTDVPFEVSTADVSGLVVHVTSRPSIVSGEVKRADGKPAVNAAVALFPVDSSTWSAPSLKNSTQFRTLRVIGGGYYFENVPRGEYYLVAVDDALLRQWRERSLLQKLTSQAVRITVAPGGELRRDLTVEER